MQPLEELRRIRARGRRILGRSLRGPDVAARRSLNGADAQKGAGPLIGNLTIDELESVVRLACYVTPRSDEEQLLLLKAASEVDRVSDVHLADDVRSSAGFPQRELDLPDALATVAKVAAVGGMLAGGWRTARRLLAVRRRRMTSNP